jgi:site-specific DNA recombinase
MKSQTSDKQSVVCYLRVSRQTSDTDRQESNLQAYAEQHQYSIAKVFKERITGVSSAFERTQFKEMLKYIEENQVKTILTTELSRIGRSKMDCISVLEYFISHKIQVIFKDNSEMKLLNAKGDRDWIAGMVLDLLINFAVMERETAISRNKDGMRHSISIGGSGYGKVKPLGFMKTEIEENGKKVKKLIVCEEEALIVKEIFSLYQKGLGTTQIANYLNNKGVKTKFNRTYESDKPIKNKNHIVKNAGDFKFVDGTIYTILKHKLYMGQRMLNDYEIIDPNKKRTKANKKLIGTNIYQIEKIIDTDTFNTVQEMLKDRYNKKGNHTVHENILRHKIVCGVCGQHYFMHKRQDNKDSAYKCMSVRYHHPCGNIGISIDKLNNSVYFLLKNFVKLNNADNQQYIEQIKQTLDNQQITKENILRDIELQNQQFENILTLNLNNVNFQEVITKQSIAIQQNIDKLKEDLKSITESIQENEQLTYDLENINFDNVVEDTETFKKYVAQTIDSLTLTFTSVENIKHINNTEINDKFSTENFKELFPHKQDKFLHCKLTTIDSKVNNFYVSQRSNKMLFHVLYADRDSNDYITIDIPKTVKI